MWIHLFSYKNMFVPCVYCSHRVFNRHGIRTHTDNAIIQPTWFAVKAVLVQSSVSNPVWAIHTAHTDWNSCIGIFHWLQHLTHSNSLSKTKIWWNFSKLLYFNQNTHTHINEWICHGNSMELVEKKMRLTRYSEYWLWICGVLFE